MQRFKITKGGYQKIKDELDNLLTVERPSVSKAIGEAIQLGDLSENEEYATAKDKQKVIDAMISTLSERLSNAEIVDIKLLANDEINFGATVKLLDLNSEKELQYQLLSEFESDINRNIIAIESLVGKSLIGKKKGDELEIKTPAGIKEYEVLSVEYK
ncbi:MAG TPA: transcription elongation factor GreA [Rickettsiales bacterium]|nr:transcription elongation factor GreA [Rickettsiales bacterium]